MHIKYAQEIASQLITTQKRPQHLSVLSLIRILTDPAVWS